MERKRFYEQPTAHVVELQVTNQLLAGSQVSADILDPEEEEMNARLFSDDIIITDEF